MGLDMNLYARKYLYQYKDKVVVEEIKEHFTELPDSCESMTIEVEFGYWRKANAIHDWFVKNVQDGVDDCDTYFVDTPALQKLLDAVNLVLANNSLAPTLLPTQSGFFFGATDYGEYYIESLKHTKDVLEKALDEKMKDWTFYYRSSW